MSNDRTESMASGKKGRPAQDQVHLELLQYLRWKNAQIRTEQGTLEILPTKGGPKLSFYIILLFTFKFGWQCTRS